MINDGLGLYHGMAYKRVYFSDQARFSLNQSRRNQEEIWTQKFGKRHGLAVQVKRDEFNQLRMRFTLFKNG